MSSRIFQNPLSRSLGLHLLLLVALFLYLKMAPKFSPPAEPITIDVLDTAKNYAKKDEDSHAHTIVQKSAGELANEAKKDSYLSDKTRTVKEQFSALRPGEVDVVPGAPGKGTTHSSNQPTEAKPEAKEVKLSDLGVHLSTKAEHAYEKERNWANSQTGEAIRGGQYIQGMKEGEVSALNTKEFVFYSYFDRVRHQLDQAWQPILREQIQRIYKTGRKLASNSDYTTRTLVTLNSKGEILRVKVLEESGTFDLDQAAVTALNKAGPYPNPPKGLIDTQGEVEIRWDFVLKT